MFSVPLSDIPRTTSFRVAVLFLALFGATSLILFGYIYWQTAGYLSSEVDAGLIRQVNNYSKQDPATLLREAQEHTRKDPERRVPLGVFDTSGLYQAGSLTTLPAIPRYDRAFEFERTTSEGKPRKIRAMAHRLDDGQVLVVSKDIHDIGEFDELLVRALESGGAIMLVLGLLGATAMGLSAKRRLDAVTHAIERIVKGNLSERLPSRGSNDDVDHLAAVVNHMLDEIERLMSEVKGVCDDIAHDLRTPLTRLLAGLERAERRALSTEDYAQAIEQAIGEARGLLVTFRALLRISEIEDSARRTGFVPVDLSRIAEDVVEFFEPLADEKHIALCFTGQVEAAWVLGDADLLFDATCNLVDNAIKFTPPSGRVEVRVNATNDGEHLELTVLDTGPGIPEEEREAVFRRFYRSERSRHTPGNGLGLSMVAAVARLHEMTLDVQDASPGCRIALGGLQYKRNLAQ